MANQIGSSRKPGSGEIMAALRRQIMAGRFFDKERMPPERALAEQFGVARGTVREALKGLEDLALVERRAGSGTYVCRAREGMSRPRAESMRPLELIEARMAVEPQIVRLAVLHANEIDLMRIAGALEDMDTNVGDADQFGDRDGVFHQRLADACHNALLIWTMRMINELRSGPCWRKVRQITHNPELAGEYNQQHRRIYDAVAARDPDTAAAAMRDHLGIARRKLIDATS
ncbi:MAG: FadR/GntR family transcriptional regulator [Rhizobiaceae bacterium]